MKRDNHSGPDYEKVRSMFPKATRFHWHRNAWNDELSCWMVGTPIECGGGSGMHWEDVPTSNIKQAA